MTDLPRNVQQLVQLALDEDIGSEDVTSEYFVPAQSRSTARIVAREPGIAAGCDVAAYVFRKVDEHTKVKIFSPSFPAFIPACKML